MEVFNKISKFVEKHYDTWIIIYFTSIWLLSVVSGTEVSNNSIFIGLFTVAIRVITLQLPENNTNLNITVNANKPDELYKNIKSRLDPILNSKGDDK